MKILKIFRKNENLKNYHRKKKKIYKNLEKIENFQKK